MTLPLAAPALPLHSAGKYVAGAYIVFLVIVLIYVAIMAARLSRTERELIELRAELGERGAAGDPPSGLPPGDRQEMERVG
jgi:hypothetical protein